MSAARSCVLLACAAACGFAGRGEARAELPPTAQDELGPPVGRSADSNRLTYLDESDPYYVGREFPRLTTPQWFGEQGVEAIVTLAIDDMRGPDGPARYDAFLRPILQRLKEIQPTAAVSVMTCTLEPSEPQLAAWLEEGLSLECHTFDHPCPILRNGDFAAARGTYERCVDLLAQVPGSRPVAFRTPCCDSLNTPSPRLFAEIFNRTTEQGNFLQMDSSVFMLFTPEDPELPRELVLVEQQAQDGASSPSPPCGGVSGSGAATPTQASAIEGEGFTERFQRYLPFPSFVNVIENYPYPYPIGRLCWEFPCMVPSDWEAQNLRGVNQPETVRDWMRALDATVVKQGTFNLVFHPHGWIQAEQVVEFIDYAHATYGDRVRFVTFREALARLNEHLLAGQPLRAADGGDNGVRLVDLNNDGYQDVVIGNEQVRRTRIWSPAEGRWIDGGFPVQLVDVDEAGHRREAGVRFGIVPLAHVDGSGTGVSPVVVMLVRSESQSGAWGFDGERWAEAPGLLAGLEIDGEPVRTSVDGRDGGVRLRDLDGDGSCELIVSGPAGNGIFAWVGDGWTRLARADGAPATFPDGTALVDGEGRDAGLRFVDLDGDGRDDVVFSSAERYATYVFVSLQEGWCEARAGLRSDDSVRSDRLQAVPRPLEAGQDERGPAEAGRCEPPMIVRGDGSNNGAWFARGFMWVQNEDTSALPDLVDRRSFAELLGRSGDE